MSTQSRIAKQLPDGTFQAVTCHFDGYPSHMGFELLNYFNAQEKVDVVTAEFMNSVQNGKIEPADEIDKQFNDELVPDIFSTLKDLIKQKNISNKNKIPLGVAHTYIWMKGAWYAHYPYLKMKPKPLVDYIPYLIKHSKEEGVTW